MTVAWETEYLSFNQCFSFRQPCAATLTECEQRIRRVFKRFGAYCFPQGEEKRPVVWKGNSMIKTAIEGAQRVAASMQPSDAVAGGQPSNNMESSSCRFPPVEHSLTQIINNTRLAEANRNG